MLLHQYRSTSPSITNTGYWNKMVMRSVLSTFFSQSDAFVSLCVMSDNAMFWFKVSRKERPSYGWISKSEWYSSCSPTSWLFRSRVQRWEKVSGHNMHLWYTAFRIAQVSQWNFFLYSHSQNKQKKAIQNLKLIGFIIIHVNFVYSVPLTH